MKTHYTVTIPSTRESFLDLQMEVAHFPAQGPANFFLPSWSPGSYLMREYAGHLLWVKAQGPHGEDLSLEKVSKNEWSIPGPIPSPFTLKARFYAHDLSVRTSYIDDEMAFLHGPTFLFGLKGQEITAPRLELRFPEDWSKVSTSLKDVSPNRETFLYEAQDYEHLLDCPILLGCHHTDGLYHKDIPHGLAWAPGALPFERGWDGLKEDLEKILQTTSDFFGELPYEQYHFLGLFAPGIYGGLEHRDSTAIAFDGRKLNNRKDYLKFLELLAHEYFHTWNVKRIRPKALGPFDYQQENYTDLLWLAEGLTSFMDQFILHRAGLCTDQEYLELQKDNFNTLLQTPGRKFTSIQESSFDAWIKFYRPNEFSSNSSVSYYLKGAVAFFLLHLQLPQIHRLIQKLWERYLKDPQSGMESQEVFHIIEGLSGPQVRDTFETWIQTTQEMDIEGGCRKGGLAIQWEEGLPPWTGISWSTSRGQLQMAKVALDSPAHKEGLLPGDELLAVDSLRVGPQDLELLEKHLSLSHTYTLTLARRGKLITKSLRPQAPPRQIKELQIVNQQLFQQYFHPYQKEHAHG